MLSERSIWIRSSSKRVFQDTWNTRVQQHRGSWTQSWTCKHPTSPASLGHAFKSSSPQPQRGNVRTFHLPRQGLSNGKRSTKIGAYVLIFALRLSGMQRATVSHAASNNEKLGHIRVISFTLAPRFSVLAAIRRVRGAEVAEAITAVDGGLPCERRMTTFDGRVES